MGFVRYRSSAIEGVSGKVKTDFQIDAWNRGARESAFNEKWATSNQVVSQRMSEKIFNFVEKFLDKYISQLIKMGFIKPRPQASWRATPPHLTSNVSEP